jgi:hypothetical protein
MNDVPPVYIVWDAKEGKFESLLGPVGIHREFITAATRWIMEAKL